MNVSASCQQAVEQVGSGIAASLLGVDCASSSMAADAFNRLFGSEGSLVPALTILLTLYVALFAFALITGRSRVGVSSLTPRIVTLGLVLTFATSWSAFQTTVVNLATGGPNEIAAAMTGTPGNATLVFAQKIDVVFQALIQASGEGTPDSAFSPPGLMWLGGTLFLLGTAGILATTRIALAVLLAIGPVFFVFALFPGTRGLFAGWLKAVVLLAITPLFAVLGGSLMLELSVPVLAALVATPGQIDAQAAMAFFMIATVYTALMILVLKVAGTMVAGWSVFGLAGGGRAAHDGGIAGPARAASAYVAAPAGAAVDQARAVTPAPSRQIRMAQAAPAAANDVAPASRHRETRVVGATGTGTNGSAGQSISRVQGVGSRFRSPPARKTEKVK
jgi:type IV secretion system protein VirB6